MAPSCKLVLCLCIILIFLIYFICVVVYRPLNMDWVVENFNEDSGNFLSFVQGTCTYEESTGWTSLFVSIPASAPGTPSDGSGNIHHLPMEFHQRNLPLCTLYALKNFMYLYGDSVAVAKLHKLDSSALGAVHEPGKQK